MTDNPQNVLVFGGGFDPVHRGHVESALYMKKIRNANLLIFVPTGISPHKQGKKKTANHIRKQILELSLEGIDDAMVEDFEMNQEGVCYFYQTVTHLYYKYRNANISFIVGADWADKLHRWRRWDVIQSLATPVIMTRPGYAEKIASPGVSIIEVPSIPISGTELRAKLAEGLYEDEMVKAFIYPKALTFIRDQRLYENDPIVTVPS